MPDENSTPEPPPQPPPEVRRLRRGRSLDSILMPGYIYSTPESIDASYCALADTLSKPSGVYVRSGKALRELTIEEIVARLNASTAATFEPFINTSETKQEPKE